MANTTTTKVTVGDRAQVFHDQATGITICKGETVALRDNQLNQLRIRQALSSGHLKYVVDKKEAAAKYTKSDIEKLQARMKAQYEKGMEIAKMASSFTLEEAKLLAEANEVKVEKDDTVESILSAILEEE